jgi:hypothetical protein
MFSRAGKSSTFKHRILGEKESILERKLKFIKPEKTEYKVHSLPIDEINFIATKEETKIKKVKVT